MAKSYQNPPTFSIPNTIDFTNYIDPGDTAVIITVRCSTNYTPSGGNLGFDIYTASDKVHSVATVSIDDIVGAATTLIAILPDNKSLYFYDFGNSAHTIYLHGSLTSSSVKKNNLWPGSGRYDTTSTCGFHSAVNVANNVSGVEGSFLMPNYAKARTVSSHVYQVESPLEPNCDDPLQIHSGTSYIDCGFVPVKANGDNSNIRSWFAPNTVNIYHAGWLMSDGCYMESLKANLGATLTTNSWNTITDSHTKAKDYVYGIYWVENDATNGGDYRFRAKGSSTDIGLKFTSGTYLGNTYGHVIVVPLDSNQQWEFWATYNGTITLYRLGFIGVHGNPTEVTATSVIDFYNKNYLINENILIKNDDHKVVMDFKDMHDPLYTQEYELALIGRRVNGSNHYRAGFNFQYTNPDYRVEYFIDVDENGVVTRLNNLVDTTTTDYSGQHTMSFDLTGTTLTLDFDGVTKVTTTDTTHPQGERTGIFFERMSKTLI